MLSDGCNGGRTIRQNQYSAILLLPARYRLPCPADRLDAGFHSGGVHLLGVADRAGAARRLDVAQFRGAIFSRWGRSQFYLHSLFSLKHNIGGHSAACAVGCTAAIL